MAPEAAFILAAGLGTRMRPLTNERPKALLRVSGRTLLDRAIDRAVEGGARRIVVNAHHCAEMIHAHCAARAAPPIAVSDERHRLLDTGGGAKRALPLIGPAPFFALNADALWTGPPPLTALAAAWDPARMDALLLLVPRARAAGRAGPGDFVSDGGRLSRGDAGVYTGAQIVRMAAVAGPPGAFSLNRVWDAAIARGRLWGVLHPGGWCDVGHPGGIAEAEAMLRESAR